MIVLTDKETAKLLKAQKALDAARKLLLSIEKSNKSFFDFTENYIVFERLHSIKWDMNFHTTGTENF